MLRDQVCLSSCSLSLNLWLWFVVKSPLMSWLLFF
uniref:Uncharacterized protein n=1 Tax=Anguilla anguilla TaxID=7936 RepID=A0A0E9XMQ7_ANGAN